LYPMAYEINGDAVKGKRVLLFDDTWTTGASIASSAAVLKSAGARSVVATAVGRQLQANGRYYNTQEIVSAVRTRNWGVHCVLCYP
jgi:orotate phosphoribosyltransferase